ncbi:MAG: FlgD immunoglobulin-like domain containing protein, partial [Calditrichia bacterium]
MAQNDTTFSELRGMEDISGCTHLFYKQASGNFSLFRNDVYHWDLQTGTDTLFLEEYNRYFPPYDYILSIEDYEFWYNDPARYIYAGASSVVDPTAYISRYDTNDVFMYLGEVENVEISRQDPNLVYAWHWFAILKSTDGGLTWQWGDSLGMPYARLLSLHPENDLVFFSEINGDLQKSVDGGFTYQPVDTAGNWNRSDYCFLFDRDSLHIFARIRKDLYLSADGGDTWQSLPFDSLQRHITLDDSLSGNYYHSRGADIFESMDYGANWFPLLTLDRPVVGLYKKADSDILYAATSKDIYRISGGSAVSIKHFPVGIEDRQPELPQDYQLLQNFPNPFNSETAIGFQLSAVSEVEISVYNLLGQKVRTLANRKFTAGEHTVKWDGRDDAGREAASGVYVYQLQTADAV